MSDNPNHISHRSIAMECPIVSVPSTLEHSSELKDLAVALAKAQAEVKGAAKDSTNPHFRSKYADLASVWDACRGPLTKNGLSVVQSPGFDTEGQQVTLTTMLLHSSGQWIRSTAATPIPKADPQGVGSALTYLRRYALAAFASVAPEDDDGESATDHMAPARPAQVSADGEPVIPFGKSKGTPITKLDTGNLNSALLWAKAAGKYAEFQTAATAELAEREAHSKKIQTQPLSERPLALASEDE